ncbi:YOR378W-like protein [Delitschia confertaspora ATCC 74209]|uniref:YOR378W-like protein n=1 Tax=Delitschia confertaspora ATCC 74209 TaxID=1513339 RepID=A0A9P4JNZ6_9PLEO|nr:YOR378W-like protein [Delitschia confertaspora ATCC 74209]
MSNSKISGILVSTNPQTTKTTMSMAHEIGLAVACCLSQFLSLGGLYQTVAPLTVFIDYFHIEKYGTLSWLSASYSLTVGTFILPAGRLGDMYGHKRIYLIGWVWFASWSLIAGFSYSAGPIFFSICRALQGIGPALLVPNAIALIGRNFPIGTKRNIAFACFGASGPTGATMGAIFSALFADLAWWPWSFWTLSLACSAALGISFLVIPDSDCNSKQPKRARKPLFDYWGCFTGVTGLILINFALNQAPIVTWANPYVGILLGAGIIFIIIFVFVELYATSHPLIPLQGLQKDAIFALACIAAGWGSHGIWAFHLYLFIERLRGQSALLASAAMSPVAFTGILFALSTVWLIKRIQVSYIMFVAMVFFLVGNLLLALVPIHQTYWAQTFLSMLVMPGAMNLSYPAAIMMLSSALPREKQGIAASLVSTVMNYSISCGLGLAGTLERYLIEVERQNRGVHDDPLTVSQSGSEAQAIRLAAFRGAYWFGVGLGGLGMLIAASFIMWGNRTKKREHQATTVY